MRFDSHNFFNCRKIKTVNTAWNKIQRKNSHPKLDFRLVQKDVDCLDSKANDLIRKKKKKSYMY